MCFVRLVVDMVGVATAERYAWVTPVGLIRANRAADTRGANSRRPDLIVHGGCWGARWVVGLVGGKVGRLTWAMLGEHAIDPLFLLLCLLGCYLLCC